MLVSYRPLAQLLLPRHRPIRLLRQSFVGVVELYDESLCLLKYKETGRLPRNCRCEHFQKNSHHLTKRTAPHALTDIAPATLSLIRKYLVAHDTPLYNVARERLLQEIKAVERATGARLGKTCGMNGDDDDGDDDAAPAGFGVGHASYKAAFPDAASSGPGGK